MANDQNQDKQDGQTPETDSFTAEREELLQAGQHFFRSLFRMGVQLALLPVNVLPPEPQRHFKAAGREFTRGLATLAHAMADDFERIVEGSQEDEENV